MALVVTELGPGLDLPDDELHIWVVRTDAGGHGGHGEDGGWPIAADVLDPQETARARRLVHHADRVAFVRVHIALRQILAGYLGVSAHDVVYEYDCAICGRRHGKPTARALSGTADVEFNLARSGQLGVVAVAAGGPLGVDIERLDQELDPAEMLAFLGPVERAELSRGGPVDRRACIATWTRKEAYAKARGIGLSLPLDTFDTTVPPEPPHLLRPAPDDEVAAWFMAELPLPEPYTGTVVAAGDSWRLRMVDWNPTNSVLPALSST